MVYKFESSTHSNLIFAYYDHEDKTKYTSSFESLQTRP
jgi:hypothetical protein